MEVHEETAPSLALPVGPVCGARVPCALDPLAPVIAEEFKRAMQRISNIPVYDTT